MKNVTTYGWCILRKLRTSPHEKLCHRRHFTRGPPTVSWRLSSTFASDNHLYVSAFSLFQNENWSFWLYTRQVCKWGAYIVDDNIATMFIVRLILDILSSLPPTNLDERTVLLGMAIMTYSCVQLAWTWTWTWTWTYMNMNTNTNVKKIDTGMDMNTNTNTDSSIDMNIVVVSFPSPYCVAMHLLKYFLGVCTTFSPQPERTAVVMSRRNATRNAVPCLDCFLGMFEGTRLSRSDRVLVTHDYKRECQWHLNNAPFLTRGWRIWAVDDPPRAVCIWVKRPTLSGQTEFHMVGGDEL